MTRSNPPSVFATPRVFWRNFAAVWFFPVFFFFGAALAGRITLFPGWLFLAIAFSLLIVGFGYLAFLCFIKHQLSYLSLIVWGMFTPWLIWSALVFAQVALQHFARSTSVA